MFEVFKELGLQRRKFRDLDKALDFWKENKDYNQVNYLMKTSRMIKGKRKYFYTRKFLKGRPSTGKKNDKSFKEELWKYRL